MRKTDGVRSFVHKNLTFKFITVDIFCVERVTEVSVIMLQLA